MLHLRLSCKIVDLVWLYFPEQINHKKRVCGVPKVKLDFEASKDAEALRILADDSMQLVILLSLGMQQMSSHV